MAARAAMQLDRLDRHVWHSYLRMSAGTSRYRAAGALEDALRLTDLPGEREGRVYYFRRVSLGAISAQAGRGIWMDRVQHTLGELAAAAVHGSDPRACASNAVYFDHQEQAFEALLRRSLRVGTGAAWFSGAILGDAPEAGGTISILRVVERLRQPDLSQAASAGILLASLAHGDPMPLLDALPLSTVRDWLREMESAQRAPARDTPISLPGSVKSTLRLAAQQLGWKEPRTLWLAALGVMAHASTAVSPDEALSRARSTLRRMALEEAWEPTDRRAPAVRGSRDLIFTAAPLDVNSAAPPDAAHDESFESLPAPTSAERGSVQPTDGSTAANPRAAAASVANADAASDVAATAGDAAALASPPATPDADPHASATALLGEPTEAAGLYFLLHVLRHLGMAEFLAQFPALLEAGFAAQVLRHLAAHAGVAAEDPILLCLEPEVVELAPLPRIWARAVRRWCRRHGGIAVRAIVRRRGRVWLTRTDLDVTLPLAAADVRIRRIGLDLDPGWLPWFGRHGRVVRFHYRDREPDA